MKMAWDERRLDIRTTKFAADRSRRGALPDCVVDVYDWCHQGDETQIAFDHRKQRPNPSTITGGEHAEFAGAAFAQCAHQLAELHYALAQTFCVADQIAGDCKFAVPIPLRNARVMVWQVNEACVPTKFVEVLRATSITNRAAGHERVRHKDCRRFPAVFGREEICVRGIVRWKLRFDRAAPCDIRV